MMKRMLTRAAMGLALTAAAVGWAAPVQLDISNYFNYDAVGTQNEIDYCNTFTGVNHRLDNILGQHNLRYGTCYAGLPEDGLVDDGYFELGKGLDRRYDVASGDALQYNSAMIVANRSTETLTVTLDAADQRTYSDINFVFNGYRHSSASGVTFSAGVEVKYAGEDAWHTLWYEQADGSVAGGSFTSGGMNSQGHFYHGTDTDTWALAHTAGQYVAGGGSDPNRYSSIRSGDRYLWKFAEALTLDSTKTLEAFRMSVSTTGVNRNNQVWLFGATANEVPEPATLSLLLLSGLGVLRRRR